MCVSFLDIYQTLPDSWFSYAPVKWQFAPSFLKWCATGSLMAGAAFLVFTLLALIFGRVYCSFICPFGILMDILRFFAKWPSKLSFLKKTAFGRFCAKRFAKLGFRPARNVLRYSLLALCALSLIVGYAGLFGLLDPYSLFGKVMGDFVRPIAVDAANWTSEVLYSWGIYAVNPVEGEGAVALPAFLFALCVLGLLAVASALRGRIFCNTLCSVGSFLSLFSRYSLFRIRLDENACVHCGSCERTCKAECIDAKSGKIDASRCVLCFDCATNCPKGGISYGLNPAWFGKKKHPLEPSKIHSQKTVSRRAFARQAAGMAALACVAAKAKGSQSEEAPQIGAPSPYGVDGDRPDKRLASPPGSVSVRHFLEHCTGCQLCTAVCPSQLLKPSITQWGILGLIQPFMDFSKGFCVHACERCSEVCPAGAILPLSPQQKRTEKIGTAIFNPSLCVVQTEGTDCAACGEHCPVQAIEMIPFGSQQRSLFIPHIHSEVCIGCGACEYVCPVRPHKAIVVQGLAVHTKAVVFQDSMRLYHPEKQSKRTLTPSGDADVFPF